MFFSVSPRRRPITDFTWSLPESFSDSAPSSGAPAVDSASSTLAFLLVVDGSFSESVLATLRFFADAYLKPKHINLALSVD
jgi:hypothetical protein